MTRRLVPRRRARLALDLPRGGDIRDGTAARATLRDLPEVEAVVSVRFGKARMVDPQGKTFESNFMAVGGEPRGTWTVMRGVALSCSRERTKTRSPDAEIAPAVVVSPGIGRMSTGANPWTRNEVTC